MFRIRSSSREQVALFVHCSLKRLMFRCGWQGSRFWKDWLDFGFPLDSFPTKDKNFPYGDIIVIMEPYLLLERKEEEEEEKI